MCIRDRDVCECAKADEQEAEQAEVTAETAEASVSYTHLDVYKRQYIHIEQTVECNFSSFIWKYVSSKLPGFNQ